MKITVKQFRKYITEALRPSQPSSTYVHASRADRSLSDAVSHLEQLALANPKLDSFVQDMIDPIHRVQEMIDKLNIKDDRFRGQ